MLLSLITILLEGIVAGSERYRAYCSSTGQRNKSTGRLESSSQQMRPTSSSTAKIVRPFQPTQCPQCSQTTQSTQPSKRTQPTEYPQTTQPIQFLPFQSSPNQMSEAIRSTEEQQRNSRGSQLLRLSSKRDKRQADSGEQFYLQIPSTILLVAYTSLIFISLFLIFRFRSLIKLCTVAYAMVLMTVSFLFLRRSLFRIHTSNLSASTALSDGSPANCGGGLEGLGRLEGSSFSSLEGTGNSGSTGKPACSTARSTGHVGNKTKLKNSKKCWMPSKFKSTFLVALVYGLNLSVSALLAYIWYTNQQNGCFWLYHNTLGILVCLFCVSALRLINFRQIFITFTLLTAADLICVYALQLHGVSVLNELVKQQQLDKRDLNDVEELNVGLNTISRVNLTANGEPVGPVGGSAVDEHVGRSAMGGEPSLDEPDESAMDKPTERPVQETVLDETTLDALAGSSGLDRHIGQIRHQNKLYRIPCVFLIPKSHLLCIDLENVAKLGFGDLIVAGIIASFCFCFDRANGTGMVYFLASLISSLGGLAFMLFVDDLLQANGQPVLLFIVPINFVVLLSLAYHRNESEEFWLSSLANDRSATDRTSAINQPEEVPFEAL